MVRRHSPLRTSVTIMLGVVMAWTMSVPAPTQASGPTPYPGAGAAPSSQPTQGASPAVASAAGAAYAVGDVFAGLSNGTVDEYSSTGALKATLATGASSYETGPCFDGSGNLYVTNFASSNMTKFNNVGSVVQYPWGGASAFGSEHPESCVVDYAQHIYVGSVDTGALREFDTAGNLLHTWYPVVENRGVDWIDLSADQCTLYYTSEGSSIKAFNVCTGTQLNDFATGLPAPCYALRILQDGEVAVACASEVALLNPNGSVNTTYTAASIGDTGNDLFAFNLTPDQSAFWTADLSTGDIWEVSFATGSVLAHFNPGTGVSGLAVFAEGGPVGAPLAPSETYGGGNPDEANPQCNHGANPVNCATGDFWHTFTDVAIPGRGLPLDLTRTYNSLDAATASPFGYGWASSYTIHLAIDPTTGVVTVVQENGATNTFTPSVSGGYTAPPRVLATLVKNADGTFTFTRRKELIFTFTSAGQLTSERDLNGYTTTLAYNGAGQLATVTDPAGRTLSFSYGANGDVSGVTDPAGRTLTYGYDAAGNLTSVTDPAGGTWGFTYDAHRLLLSMTDPRGGTVTNSYDAQGRVTAQTDALGHTTTYTYTSSGTTITDPNGAQEVQTYTAGELTGLTQAAGTSAAASWQFAYDQYTLGVTATTDPNGHVTRRGYDADGNLTSVTDALGRTSSMTYTSLNEVASLTDPAGTTTSYTYDSAGNLLSVSRPLGGSSSTQTTTYAYGDSAHPGDVTAVSDPDGHAWSFAYDSAGDLTGITDPTANTTTMAYNVLGERTSLVSGLGNTTTFAYDTLGDLTKVTDPSGHATSYAYDPDRNRTSISDPSGHVTSYTYDAANELVKVSRPDGTALSYAYDGDGNQVGQTDGAGKTTSYTYDALDRLTQVTDPLNRTTAMAYDPASNLISQTNPSGAVTSYGYDAANQLTSIGYSDGTTPSVNYTYTPDGQRASMTDGTGSTSYTYDSLNRLTQATNGAGQTVGYGHDLAGLLTSLTYPDGTSVSRGYDAAGRLTSVTDAAGNTTRLSYDADGQLTGETFPNGVTTTLTRDAADQITSIADTQGGTALATFSYTRDAANQVTSETDTGAISASHSYSYTQLNQLASQDGATFTYDAADNLTQLASGATLTYDAANELTSLVQGSVTLTFSYDQQGNRLNGVTPTGTPVTYTYDQANRLTAAQGGGSSTGAGLVAGGEYHSLAVTNSGSVYAWGNNTYGQLGNGTTTTSTTPVQVSGLTGASAVAAGDLHSVALAGGVVWTFGNNSYGQLGNDTTTNSTSPVQVSGLSGVTAVAAGNYHTLARKSDGSVWDWGLNNAGQLGTGTTTNSSTPVQVSGLSGVIAIAGGGLPGYAGHSLALKSDGTVWAWGYGKHGQLGQGANASSLTAVEVSGLTHVVAIAAAGDDSYALKSDGTLWAWGSNAYGQLGNTSAGHTSNVPVEVAISSVTSIGAGATAAYAVKSDGTVWAWGDNNTGQLGDGAVCGKTCTTPVQVSGLTSPTVVTGGYVHALAALPAGSVWAWGSNTYGQLGNGTTTVATTPVQTTGPSGVKPAPSVQASYAYDGDGLLASRTAGGTTQHFAYDLSAGLPLLLTDGATDYLYGPGDLPIEQVTSGTPLYYQADQLGSTRLLTDATGAVVATFSYGPYGQLTSHTGSADTPLRWAGQYEDPATGLYYLRARFYDPSTGQFLSRDPLGSFTQTAYLYVGGDPLNLRDLTGLCWPGWACGLENAFAGAANAVVSGAETAANVVTTGVGDAAGFAEQHPLETVALVAGAVSVATGVGALLDATLVIGALTVDSTVLGGVSIGTAEIAGAADLPGCFGGSTAACIGAGIGITGGLLGAPDLVAEWLGLTIETSVARAWTYAAAWMGVQLGIIGTVYDTTRTFAEAVGPKRC